MVARALAALAPLALIAAFAAPAQAINGYDCSQTIRGNSPHVGYHGMDNDAYRVWQWYEASRGVNIVASWAYNWWNINNAYNRIGVAWSYQRANGQLINHAFRCDDLRPYGQGFTDESWYNISG